MGGLEGDRKIGFPDIVGRMLFLLTAALDTDNVTTILASCYSGAELRGNTVVRQDAIAPT